MSAASITRRSLVAGLAATPLLAALPGGLPLARAAQMPSLEFDILRKGSTIGTHRVTAETSAQGLSVGIETDIHVRVLGITAYRYRHEAREDWRRDGAGLRLAALRTRTDDDGEIFTVAGRATADAFRIEGVEGATEAPPEIVPASYWTPLVLERDRLLGTKRGNVFPVRIEARGRETIESAGETIEAERFFIDGDPAVSLWFDDERRIRRLAFETRGEFIDYRLRQMDAIGLNERVF